MKVFISWSGEQSLAVAKALRGWLPQVIQVVTPWMSAEDIERGARWSVDIAQQLEECRVGLICLTPENREAPWILFEAGALAKTLDHTFVCPYLLGLHASDLQGPLVQFQATRAEKEETRKLLHTINKAVALVANEQALSEGHLNAAFEKWWPDLDIQLRAIPPAPMPSPAKRPEREIQEEVLEIVRVLLRRDARRDPGVPVRMVVEVLKHHATHGGQTVREVQESMGITDMMSPEEVAEIYERAWQQLGVGKG
jgi:hypothetical protein